MAITNANDSRPRDDRGREARSNENYKPRTSRETGSNNVTTGQATREYKPYNRESKPYTKPFGSVRDNKDGKSTGGFNKSRDFKGGSYNKDKDYDSDNRNGKSYGNGKDQRTGDSRLKTGQTKEKEKEKEKQPEKFVTIKRIEKEKKVLQKKSLEINKKPEDQNKPQLKQKRTNNIHWTEGYSNGMYGDDDEDYTQFL